MLSYEDVCRHGASTPVYSTGRSELEGEKMGHFAAAVSSARKQQVQRSVAAAAAAAAAAAGNAQNTTKLPHPRAPDEEPHGPPETAKTTTIHTKHHPLYGSTYRLSVFLLGTPYPPLLHDKQNKIK